MAKAGLLFKMSGGLSVHNEMIAIAQEAADLAALNALNILAAWVAEKGHPELASEMLESFAAPSEGIAADAADPVAEPDPEAVQPAPYKAPPEEAILIGGEEV